MLKLVSKLDIVHLHKVSTDKWVANEIVYIDSPCIITKIVL